MNKIFKVKKNRLGRSVVCSEIAKSTTKGKVLGQTLLATLVVSVGMGTAFAKSGYVTTGLPNDVGYANTVYEFTVDVNPSNNPNVVENTYTNEGSETDPNRVYSRDALGAVTIQDGVSTSLVTGFSNNLTDTALLTMNGFSNVINNASQISVNGVYNKVNGLKASQIIGSENNVSTLYKDPDPVQDRMVSLVGTANNVKSNANILGSFNNVAESIEKSNILGNGTIVTASNTVALGYGTVADRANTVSVGKTGEERQIVNVKAATQDTDAVNFKQLKDEIGKVKPATVDISGKADKTYVDDKNQAQDAKIQDAQNTADLAETKAQQAIDGLASKVDNSHFQADQDAQNAKIKANSDKNTQQDTLIAGKADKTYVDILDNSQKSINALQDIQLKELNGRIARNSQTLSGLTQRVNNLEKDLSGGIAGAVAIGMLPTTTEAGVRMLSAGTGYHNGETAIAIGLTGTTQSGKYSFKLGGSYATNGGSTFGGGIGYRF